MLLYAVNGDVFVYGSRMTWSLMPDGTNLGGVTSNLASTLNQELGSGNWLHAFQDAFAQWENYGNFNFSQVGDNGSPLDSGNYQQGSPNFGDIRIGGYPMASNILAYTLLPPPNNGGSDSGDIFFNTAIPWKINNDYDLETVAIHEIGHDVGLGESSDVNASMYTYYNGVQQQLNTDDVDGVQAIWEPRKEDGLAAGNSNFTPTHAASITPFINGANDQIVLPNQDVASSAESYWFKVTTPANASNNLTVQIQSTWLSELSPKVQIYNAALKGLVQVSAPSNAYGTIVDASISNASPNTTYYIRVLGSNGGETGTGAYGMTVNMGRSAIGMISPPNTTVYAQPDQGSGGQYDRIGGGGLPGDGGWNPGSDWKGASIHDLESRGDDLMTSPWAPSSGTPQDPTVAGAGQSSSNFVTSLITSIATASAQSGFGLSSPDLPSLGLSNSSPTSASATSAELPTVLVDVPHPTYNSTARDQWNS